MSWTYDLPVEGEFPTVKDQVRFLVRDTTQSQASVSDEEVDYLVHQWAAAHPSGTLETADAYLVASQVAELMADAYAGYAATTKTTGQNSLTRQYGGEAERYRELAARLAALSPDNTARAQLYTGFGLVSQHAYDGQPRVFSMRQMDNGTGGER